MSLHREDTSLNLKQLEGILQHRSTQVNHLTATKSANSAMNMESMTREMNIIADRTKLEATSTRILTVFALIYLPGSLIAVSSTKNPLLN